MPQETARWVKKKKTKQTKLFSSGYICRQEIRLLSYSGAKVQSLVTRKGDREIRSVSGSSRITRESWHDDHAQHQHHHE